MREHTPRPERIDIAQHCTAVRRNERAEHRGLLRLQRDAGNRAVARLVAQREPYSEAGATERALQIDAQVRADPTMPLAELERLLQERNRILPLTSSPPRTTATPPAGPPPAPAPGSAPGVDATSRWAPTAPDTIPDAIPIAAGMVMVPLNSGPPPVPPSVLFPELLGAETGVATAGAELGTATVVTEVGAGAVEVGAGVGTATTAAGTSSVVPVVGWVVAGVIVLGIVGYLLYRHFSTSVATPAGGRPERIDAPGAAGTGPLLLPGAPAVGPMSLPGGRDTGPISLPGTTTPGPMSLPGAPRPEGPLLASRLPTHRTDFPTRDAARARAEQLARTIVNGELELIERAETYGTPEERGLVDYYRRQGSTAEMRGPEPRGNIVCIVEHTSDPSQPPHFHVVRPPIEGARIEHGGAYLQLFPGTPDEHLTINPAGTPTVTGRR
jgi:hypothetical protein